MRRIVFSVLCMLLITSAALNAQVIHRTSSSNTVTAAITTKTITKHKKEKKVIPQYLRPLGFRQMAELNLGTINLGVDYVAGYKFNQYFFLGAGFGLEAIYDSHMSCSLVDKNKIAYKHTAFNFPIYVNAKGYFTKTRVQPYLDLSLGGHFGDARGLAGVLFDFGPGINVYINEKLAFYAVIKGAIITQTAYRLEDHWHYNLQHQRVYDYTSVEYLESSRPEISMQVHIGLEF